MARLLHVWRAYERWLRIDPEAPRWDVLRARATYAVAWLFAVLQGFNLVGMTYSYGGWTSDHWVALSASVLIVLGSFGLRYTKRAVLYAGSYAALMLIGLSLSSLPSGTGIDSALLPFLVVSPIALGFMCGWRAAFVFWAFALGLLVILAAHTGRADGLILGGLTTAQEQRLFQGCLAASLAAGVACLLSAAAQRALENLEAAVERVRAAEAAKADFLACMSHELRTPLNGMLGLTESVLRDADAPLPQRQRDLLQTAYDAGSNLFTVLNDVLDLAKLDAGGLTLEARAFDPVAVADGVAAVFAPAATDKAVRLVVIHETGTPRCVLGDDHRVRQIVTNLVSNAVKFTSAGQVTIAVAPTPDGFRIAVEDTGPGVPEDRRTAIFRPFEQADTGTTRRHGGTGLGLTICAQLAGRMGGRVALERTGAEGSRFALTLPAPPARPAADAPAATAPTLPEGLRVLVAEDNAVNRLVVAEFLRALGAEATFAEDGQQALDALALAPFDLVLMDKHMPVMDGVAATQAIRRSGAPFAAVPIVALTADAMAGERERLLGIGMDAFASKPVRLDTLRAALREGLDAGRERAACAA